MSRWEIALARRWLEKRGNWGENQWDWLRRDEGGKLCISRKQGEARETSVNGEPQQGETRKVVQRATNKIGS